MIVKVPPGVPHEAINPSADPRVFINAVLRHEAACERDYRPLRQPFPYDMNTANRLLQDLNYLTTA